MKIRASPSSLFIFLITASSRPQPANSRTKMAKIYPNSPISSSPLASISSESEPASLTVWRKSLLFSCSGFTVFDSKGNLVFRVDNYSSTSRNEIVLMDAAGKPLYTIRRKVPDPYNSASSYSH